MTRLVLIPSKNEFDRLYPGQGSQEDGTILAYRCDGAIWAVCGIGAGVSTLICERLLQKYGDEISEVFLLGVAGAFPNSGLKPGDVVQAKSECFADLGYQDEEGFHNLDDMGLPMLTASYGIIGAETGMHLWDEQTTSAHFITRNTMTTDHASAQQLEARFEAQVENMEGAGIALAAAMRQLHFYQVRGISNMVGPRDKASWKLDEALEALSAWYQAQPSCRKVHEEALAVREEREARESYFAYLDQMDKDQHDGYDQAFKDLF